MKLNQEELKYIVSESVKKILSEKRGVLDIKLRNLSVYIYDFVNNFVSNNNFFIYKEIPFDIIKQYYPYKNPQKLFIKTTQNQDFVLTFNDKTNCLIINLDWFFKKDKKNFLSDISHELTHYVNKNEGNIKDCFLPNENSVNYENIKFFSYLMKATECNARCSGFGDFLNHSKKIYNIDHYEDITHLNKILSLISFFEDNLEAQEELRKCSGETFQKLLKRFRKYKSKINKIYSDFKSSTSSTDERNL